MRTLPMTSVKKVGAIVRMMRPKRMPTTSSPSTPGSPCFSTIAPHAARKRMAKMNTMPMSTAWCRSCSPLPAVPELANAAAGNSTARPATPEQDFRSQVIRFTTSSHPPNWRFDPSTEPQELCCSRQLPFPRLSFCLKRTKEIGI